MVQSKAKSVKEYLAELPTDRRKEIEKVRKVILANLPKGYEEGMDFGMIVYYIPLSRYPDTYNKHPLGVAALAAQKNYLSVYLTCVYGDAKYLEWFKKAFAAAGKKLDMGKSCVRFKSADDLPLEVIGDAIAKVSVDELIKNYEKVRKQLAEGKLKK
ncbi:MAG: DUF1801 domain-containing protein [bacterium]|nr:DUF1801 domain-containing protein [bacterium]